MATALGVERSQVRLSKSCSSRRNRLAFFVSLFQHLHRRLSSSPQQPVPLAVREALGEALMPSWSWQVLSCSTAGEMLAACITQALCPKMILTYPHTYKHPAERQGAMHAQKYDFSFIHT